ncbi:MAG: anaerobic C4-dicarboxylate transporter family protein, partial [Mitsuokella jalaludinii]|nr:anaerobic C4-dicarboxylate transporter family protein [Mitsuokella jalaludinii]
MEMLLGLIVLLACLVFGVRHGGIGLAVISGIGLVIFTFVFGYKPGTPPIGVMLTILAVVTCAGFLQTSGGLTVMLSYANQYMKPFNDISSVITELQNALACAARVFELIEAEPESADAPAELTEPVGRVDIED